MLRECLALVGTLMVVSAAHATTAGPTAAPLTTLDMRDAKCTIVGSNREAAVEQMSSQKGIIDHQLAVLSDFRNLTDSRPWRKNVSMGEQMTPDEANRFGNLQEQIKIGTLSMLLESKRNRDLVVLAQMANVANRMKGEYQFSQDRNSDEYNLAMLLTVAREKYALSNAEEVVLIDGSGLCTFENALIAEAWRVLNGARQVPGFDQAGPDIQSLATKYGDPLDRSKLTDDEKLIFDRSRAVLMVALGRQNYYKDLLFIARLEGVSELQRDVRRRSQFEAPGSNDHINVVWADWLKTDKISASQDNLSAVLNYIDTKFPSEMVKEMNTSPASAKPAH